MIVLRPDQQECVSTCLGVHKGRVTYPTGSGKTYVASEVIAREFKASSSPSSAVVFVPRLLLGKQWIKTLGKYLIQQSGLNVNFVNVNSGHLSSKIKGAIARVLHEVSGSIRPIISSTNPDDVENEIRDLNNHGYHVVVICTYHSNDILLNVRNEFAAAIYDECQFIAYDTNFFRSVDVLARSKFFFTATPRLTDSDSGYGMDNESVYGREIFKKTPKEMIDIGAIVGPRLHVIGTSASLNDEHIEHTCFNAILEVISKSFDAHKKVVTSNSFDGDRIGAKLLVICNGQLQLKGIMNSKSFRDFRAARPEVKIFALSSEFGVYLNGDMNNPPVTNSVKEEFLEQLDELSENDDAIIFHVDMVAEGLDVPGITGVMPLRNLGQTKFLQNLGRATRPHAFDRERINDGSLKVGSYKKYIKPNCYVLLPYFLEFKEDFIARNIDIVLALRSQYDFDPAEHVIIDILNPNETGPEFDEDKLKKDIRGTIISDIKEVYHEIETEECSEERLEWRLRFRDGLLSGKIEEFLLTLSK